MSSTPVLLQTIKSSWQIIRSVQFKPTEFSRKMKGEGKKIQADDNRSHQKNNIPFMQSSHVCW